MRVSSPLSPSGGRPRPRQRARNIRTAATSQYRIGLARAGCQSRWPEGLRATAWRRAPFSAMLPSTEEGVAMAHWEKTLQQVMSGQADASIAFRDLCALLPHVGYIEDRQKGSHHIFIH